MRAAILFIIFSAFSVTLLAQEVDPKKYGVNEDVYVPDGIPVDTIAPPFQAVSLKGDTLNSADLLKKGPIVLLFYRGKWCGVCTRYLSNMNDSLDYLLKRGARVIAVGPELPKNAKQMQEKTGANFEFVSDADMRIMRDYDVLFTVTKGYQRRIKVGKTTNIAKNNGQKVAQIPVPATYVIGLDGKIKMVQFDYKYSNRATIKSILNALDKVQ